MLPPCRQFIIGVLHYMDVCRLQEISQFDNQKHLSLIASKLNGTKMNQSSPSVIQKSKIEIS
jgi:hypothetical protein